MPSNLKKMMDTNEEGTTAVVTHLTTHIKAEATQSSINIFYIPDIDMEITNTTGETTTLRQQLIEVTDAIALYTNDHTNIPGHYRIIVANTKTPDDKAEEEERKRKAAEHLLKIVFHTDHLYNKEWGIPSTYRSVQLEQNTQTAQTHASSYVQCQKEFIKKTLEKAKAQELLAQQKLKSKEALNQTNTKYHKEIQPKANAWNTPLQTSQHPRPQIEANKTNPKIQAIRAFPEDTNDTDDNDSKYNQVLAWSNQDHKEHFIQRMSQVLGIDKIQEENKALRTQLEDQGKNLDNKLSNLTDKIKTTTTTTETINHQIQQMHVQQKTIEQQVHTIATGQSELQTMMQMMQQLTNIVPLVHQMARNSGIINTDTQSSLAPTLQSTETPTPATDILTNHLEPAGTNTVTRGIQP
jgi:hypothetical protein